MDGLTNQAQREAPPPLRAHDLWKRGLLPMAGWHEGKLPLRDADKMSCVHVAAPRPCMRFACLFVCLLKAARFFLALPKP